MLPGPRASQREGQGGSGACMLAGRQREAQEVGGKATGQAGQETPREHARNAASPPPQGSPARRTTTSYGPHLMSGATSVCWGTRLSSSGGPPHTTCFNGEDFDRPVVVSNCSCTREDYEWLVLQPRQGPRALLVPQQ